MMYKTLNGMAPKYMEDMFSQHTGNFSYNLRASCKNDALPQPKTYYSRNSFAFTVAKLWNSLPNDLKDESSIDKPKFTSDLSSVEWSEVQNCNEVDKALSLWKTKFLEVLDKHAPVRVIQSRSKQIPWINSFVKKQMRERDALKRKAIRTGSPDDWNAFRILHNKVSYEVKET